MAFASTTGVGDVLSGGVNSVSETAPPSCYANAGFGTSGVAVGVVACSFSLDSWLQYRRGNAAQSSLYSINTAPTSRRVAAWLGKMPTTSARRPISRCSRSRGLVESIGCQCCSGRKLLYARSSSAAASNRAAALGKQGRKRLHDVGPCLLRQRAAPAPRATPSGQASTGTSLVFTPLD